MSSVPLKDADDQVFRPDTFTRDEGGATVHMQAVVPVDPASGLPNAATEATLAALSSAIATLNAAASAIKTAVESLNGKTSSVNTGSISGVVALDAPTLAALEIITANTGLAQPLTDAQLRAAAVAVSGTLALDAPTLAALETISIGNFPATQPISAAALPLPAGAATESTLAAVSSKLPVLNGGRMPVELPTGGIGLTDDELRAAPVPVVGSFTATVTPDETAALMTALRALVHPIWEETTSGRLRVVLDPLGGAQTLGTVTTVGTVTAVTTVATLTNIAQIGGVAANSFIYDQMHAAWANSVRRAIA